MSRSAKRLVPALAVICSTDFGVVLSVLCTHAIHAHALPFRLCGQRGGRLQLPVRRLSPRERAAAVTVVLA
jgi:hypothetical protein